jgi:hypothetical protein
MVAEGLGHDAKGDHAHDVMATTPASVEAVLMVAGVLAKTLRKEFSDGLAALEQRSQDAAGRDAQNEKVNARFITGLAERIKALEDRPAVEYLGVFDPGRVYQRGALVTHHGSIWACMAASACGIRPGTPADESKTWVLAAKGGRDGRDGKDR